MGMHPTIELVMILGEEPSEELLDTFGQDEYIDEPHITQWIACDYGRVDIPSLEEATADLLKQLPEGVKYKETYFQLGFH